MNSLLITFIILNILNVILQNVKSLCIEKYGKRTASHIDAVAYGLYTIVIIYALYDLSLFTKAFIVAICNLIVSISLN